MKKSIVLLSIIAIFTMFVISCAQPAPATPTKPPAPAAATTPATTAPKPATAPAATTTPAAAPKPAAATTTPAPAPPKPAFPDVIMASTTSTRDSGLMDVLIPLFQQKTGYVLKSIYVGSGQAMTMGQQGQADVLLVHAPASEVKFMQDGYGLTRKLIMHNDYVIVGPPSDPAKIKAMTSATDALKKMGEAKNRFLQPRR